MAFPALTVGSEHLLIGYVAFAQPQTQKKQCKQKKVHPSQLPRVLTLKSGYLKITFLPFRITIPLYCAFTF